MISAFAGQCQARQVRLEYRHGAAAQCAGHVVLVGLRAHQSRRGEEQHRIAAHHRRRRHQLATFLVLLHVHVAMLALDDLGAQDVLAQHLRAIGAQVGPAGVRVLGDEVARGHEEAPAIVGVEPRHGEALEVDGIARDDVLHHRRVVHVRGFDHLLGGQLHPLLGQLAHRQRRVLFQRDGQPLGCSEGTG
jgi:hypothetical protein